MSHKTRHITNLHIPESELRCKNGCGFYGNVAWQGYCSQCYRELHQKPKTAVLPEEHTPIRRKVTRSASDASETASHLFSKFEEKKRQQSEKRTKALKSFIKRASTIKEKATPTNWKEPRLFSLDSPQFAGKEENTEFSKSLQKVAAFDVRKLIHAQVDNIQRKEHAIDELAELVQDFYQAMEERFETHANYQGATPEQIEQLIDYTEKYLMTQLHKTAFGQISAEGEEKDLAIQKRIRNLSWVTPQHLEAEINLNHPEVADLIDKAITDIIEMDSKVTPHEKLDAIVRCSKHIFMMLQVCRGAPASADEFLPALVYIVLKANPPLLHSNIRYITLFSMQSHLNSGEGGYYFTNLCCAVHFIENLTAESLNLSQEEFNRYISGEAVPSGSSCDQNPFLCEGLRLMYQNLATLSDLRQRQEKLLTDTLSLQEEMNVFKESISKEMQSVLSTPPPAIYPYRIPPGVEMTMVPSALRCRVVTEESHTSLTGTEVYLSISGQPNLLVHLEDESEDKHVERSSSKDGGPPEVASGKPRSAVEVFEAEVSPLVPTKDEGGGLESKLNRKEDRREEPTTIFPFSFEEHGAPIATTVMEQTSSRIEAAPRTPNVFGTPFVTGESIAYPSPLSPDPATENTMLNLPPPLVPQVVAPVVTAGQESSEAVVPPVAPQPTDNSKVDCAA